MKVRLAHVVALVCAALTLLANVTVVCQRPREREAPETTARPGETMPLYPGRLARTVGPCDPPIIELPDIIETAATPVPLGDVVTLRGAIGVTARVRAVRSHDATTYTVRIENTGCKPFSRWLEAAYLDPGDGGRYYPDDSRPHTAPSPTIDPGAEADVVLVWVFRKPIRLTRLAVTLNLGHYYATAEWILTP